MIRSIILGNELSKRETMDNFKEAEVYDRTSSHQREDGANLISLLSIKKGSKILDLGCGTGYLTKALAAEVGSTGKVQTSKSSSL